MKETNPNTWRYKMLKGYLRLMHETLLVRHRYTLGLENLPGKDEKYIIVCNHQNTANDPLNIVLALPLNYHVCALARANVFKVNPLFTKFLHWIGLLPAFRLGWEGFDGLENNFETFDLIAERIHHPYPVIIFPEAGHTQGHYLDRFTTGTVRMAFHAAKAANWQEDIKIVPTAHHYSDYFDIQTDFLWMIAKPISLKSYYQAFQEHPNSVMRDITRKMRGTIQEMMLDEGHDNYETKDFLRCSALNQATLKDLPLPERLKEDKAFINMLNENPQFQEIIRLSALLKDEESSIGIDDIMMEKEPRWLKTLCRVAVLVCLLPLWIISLWPHAICYAFPPCLIKTDKMFINSYRFIMSVLFLYPIFALLTIVIMGTVWGWWLQALLWILMWIPTGRFCWWYYQRLKTTVKELRFLSSPKEVNAIGLLRTKIKELLYQKHK